MEIVTTIALLYQTLLGRQAEQEEIAFWAEKVKTDGIEATIDAIRQSTEAGVVENKLAVIALYQSMLGRLPDIDGLNFFAAAIAEGSIKLQDFPQILAGSDEFKAENPGLPVPLSTKQIITLVYENLLGREPDSGGLTYFTNAVASGSLSFKDMLEAIATSDEFVDSRGDALQDYLLDIADGRIDDPKNTGSLGSEPTPTPPTNPTPPGGGGSGEEPEVQTLTVAEARNLGPYGEDYKLLDTLNNIFSADPLIVARAESYSLSNPSGGVGPLTVAKAVVLEAAENQTDYDYSLTDTDSAIKGSSLEIRLEADTVAVVGTAGADVLDYRTFERGVILNGNGGVNETLFGSAFNDAIYTGAVSSSLGSAEVIGGRGSDTIGLGADSADTVTLTSSSSAIGFIGEVDYVNGFDNGFNNADKIKISASDTSAVGTDDPTGSAMVLSQQSNGTIVDTNPIMASYDFLAFESAINDRANLRAAFDGTEFFKGFATTGSIGGIQMHSQWTGFYIVYDDDKAHLYHATTGADTVVTANEIQLVAIVGLTSADSEYLGERHFTF